MAPPPATAGPLEERAAVLNRSLKSQFTSSDARAERMFRSVRGEFEDLRRSLDVLSIGHEEMLDLNLAAVAADPDAAATLPPSVLVRALMAAAELHEKLEGQVDEATEKIVTLQDEVQSLLLQRAALQGRLQTFEDIVAALHANLKDLRGERDRQLSEAPRPAAIAADYSVHVDPPR
jgi:FtsZ-binding cell division protein ZapB